MSPTRSACHVQTPRPTAREAWPFFLVAALGLGSTLAPPYLESGAQLWLMAGICAVILGIIGVGLRRRERTWVDPMPAYLFFAVLALARDLTGGSSSGLGALVALPIIWLAVTGTRRELWVASVLTPLLFLAPMVLVGPPEYVVADWRRALGWAAFAVFVAPVVQRIVQRLAQETERARAARAETDSILRGAHLTSIVSTDLDGTIRSFSVGAEELLGYGSDEMVGRSAALFHDPAEVAAAADELGVEPGASVFLALAKAAAPSRIWTYIHADGSRGFVRLAFTELLDSDGKTTGVLSVGIDSTAAVRAQRALSQSEARWRVLMDHLPEITLVLVDGKAEIKVIAGAGAVAQGLRGTEGFLISEVSNRENTMILKGLIEQALAGQEAAGEILSSATGAAHEVVVTPLPDDGDEQRALILARDVSAERARERALVRAKRRAERLFADAPHGVAVLALDGTVLHANAAMLALAGVTGSELEGRPLSALSRPGGTDLERHLEHVLASAGVAVETDWTLRGAHGEEVHVVLSSRALRGEDDPDDVVLVNVVDVSERRRYELRLAHLADHDVLTGLANRRRFERVLDAHLERCRRYGPTGALLLLDLDHFKDVNDTLGHAAGDQLIISTAQLLRSGLRSGDVVARIGGDEFAILLAEGDRAAAEAVAESVVTKVRKHTAMLDGTHRRVTASVGVVTLQAASAHPSDVLALADMTMYDAKDAGRNQYAILDEDSTRLPRTGARLQWKSRIERALEDGDFVLHLQPIQDLRTGEIHSAEALVRMCDGDELIPPGRFLYIAERAGLVPALDSWVVEHGVAMLADLRALDPAFRLEVNLSGLSIGHPGTEQVIVDALRRHAVDPAALILEITETAAVSDVGLAREFAERMTALGCKFALDDFGAGFGSFYYLKHLLFDFVKIDGEFVANCHQSDVDRTILRSIVGIAGDLGKETVAEFVCDPEILDIVRAEGVDHAQGFLLGEPVPYDEFVARFLPSAAAAATAPSHPIAH